MTDVPAARRRRRGAAALAVTLAPVLVVGASPAAAPAGEPDGFAGESAPETPATSGAYAWDSAFAGPGLDGRVSAAVVWDGGDGPALYVAGDFATAAGERTSRVARWDGERWSALSGPAGAGVTGGAVSTLAVYEGDLVAGGSFTHAGGEPVGHIARWDGDQWHALSGPDGRGVQGSPAPGVFDLHVHDGDLVAGGAFRRAGGLEVHHVARWDGTRWHAYVDDEAPDAPRGVDHRLVPPAVNALAERDGDLVVAGRFTEAGDQEAAGVARWDGATWSAVGDGVGGMPVPTVSALAAFDGDLVAAGQFPEMAGETANHLARWDGQEWHPLSGPDGVGVSDPASTLAVFDGELVVGGRFSEAGGHQAHLVARWDGAQWAPLGDGDTAGVSSPGTAHVSALLPYDGTLVVGGAFTTADQAVANNLAEWSPADGWRALPDRAGTGLGGWVYSTQAVTEYQGDLVVGGGFTHAGTDAAARRVARWDGETWSALGSGFDDYQVRALTVFDGDLVAGGSFQHADGEVVDRVARWDGQQWTPLESGGQVGVDGEVTALTVFDGELVAGGSFTTAGGETVNHLATWDGSRWAPVSADGGVGVDGYVRAFAHYGSDLIVGGVFTTAGGHEVDRVARWDGQQWHPLAGPDGTGVGGQVNAFAVDGDDLYVGGTFHEAGGVDAERMAHWDGTGWSALGEGMDNTVMSLEMFDGDVVAGGAFDRAGGEAAPHVARWDGQQWQPLSGPDGDGVDDWVLELWTGDAMPGALVAGGYFTVTGGVGNWTLGVYRDAVTPEVAVSPTTLDAEATVGEETTLALEVANTGDAELAWQVATGPGCALPAWLRADPAQGSVPAGGGEQVRVTLDAAGHDPGDHRATLCVDSNDPDEPRVEVPVTFTVTEPAPLECDRTVTGVHDQPLTVTEGTTCLAAGAQVLGEVAVHPGAGLVASAAVVQGPVSVTGGAAVELEYSAVTGPVTVHGVQGPVSLFANQVTGGVQLADTTAPDAPVVAGNTVIGALVCMGNAPPPTDLGLSNTATAGLLGQCADA